MVILIEKRLLRCPYCFRLENILGDRPDVRPPAIYGSGAGEGETTGVETLLHVMATPAGAVETRESTNEKEPSREEGVGINWAGQREEGEVVWRGGGNGDDRVEEEWPEGIGLEEGEWEIEEEVRIGSVI